MRKVVIMCLLSVLYQNDFAQSALITPSGISLPVFTTANRPAVNSVYQGTLIYNSTENSPQFSDGTVWNSTIGTNILPTGTANQTLRHNGTSWVADSNLQSDGLSVWVGNFTPNSSDKFSVKALNTDNAIKGNSERGTAIMGTSNSSFGIYGQSTSGSGVVGTSYSGYGVEGVSNYGVGLLAQSINNYGLYASSQTSYSAAFQGRLDLKKGGNGDAGIDFENSNLITKGYIGMNGDNEMGLYGYGLANWVQRWNVNTGTICYATAPTICSDVRLKKDFSVLNSSLSRLLNLTGYHYYWKNENMTGLQTGFIAQELQKIFPELVEENTDGFLSVSYIGLIPHLVEGIKTLKNTNDELRQKRELLEARFAKIEALLTEKSK